MPVQYFPVEPFEPLLFNQEAKAEKVLKTAKEFLNKQPNVKWWIGGGTMLGAHRNGVILPHDTDLDIEIYERAWFEGFPGQLFRVTTGEDNTIYQMAFLCDGIIMDFHFWYRKGDKLEVLSERTDGPAWLEYPARWLDEMTTTDINGEEYPCFPGDEFCELMYGPTWRTPSALKCFLASSR